MYENSDDQAGGSRARRSSGASASGEYVYFAIGADKYHILRVGEGSGVRAWCGLFYYASGVEVLQDGEQPTRPVCRKCESRAPKPKRDGARDSVQGSLL